MKNNRKLIFISMIQFAALWIMHRKIVELKKNDKLLEKKAEKENHNYAIAAEWVKLFQCKKSIADYLEHLGYHSVIIYGLSDMGCRLYDELKNSNIKIKCIIDKSAFGKMDEIRIYNPGDQIPDADVIIVATAYFLIEVENALLGKVKCPIIALDDLIAETYISEA